MSALCDLLMIEAPRIAQCDEDVRDDNDAMQRTTARAYKRRDWMEGPFVKGPVCVEWLARAGALPGKALLLGLALWYKSGLRETFEGLTVSSALLARFGIEDRGIKYRALRALEGAGLIRVHRRPGKNPLVDILGVRVAEG